MLKVLTLNINGYGTKYGPWEVRREMIQESIQRAEPDIVAMQAVQQDPAIEGGLDSAEQLSRRLPAYRYTHYQPAMNFPDGSMSGSAFLSRLPIAEIGELPLTLLPDLDDANRRVLVHARFDLPGESVHVFNGHFSWVAEQTELTLEEVFPYIRSFHGPAMLVGDLNTPSDSSLLERFRAAGLTDVWEMLHPEEPGYTFESNEPSIRIDYCWVNAALKPYASEIEIVANEQNQSGARPSDHLGLLVAFNLDT